MFNKTDVKEKLLTFSVFTGIFLPVRLFFYTFVSTWWLGSFGLVTGVMLTTLYLARKGKLGWVGRIINRQVMRMSKGKLGVASIILSIFFLVIYSNVLYGMAYPPQTVTDQVKDVLTEQGVTDLKSIVANSQHKLTITDLLLAAPLGMLIMIIPSEPGHALFAIINEYSFGWFQHFMTVYFVQQLEILGLVVYFRYFYKPNLVVSDH